MAQIRGTAGYNLGHQNPFGGPGRADATSDPSPLDAIREQTSKIEDWLDQFDMFSIYEVLPQVLELWGENLVTDVTSKKRLAEVSGK